jgi:hypothetical protein
MHAEPFAPAVLAHGDGDDHGTADDAAALADLDGGGGWRASDSAAAG